MSKGAGRILVGVEETAAALAPLGTAAGAWLVAAGSGGTAAAGWVLLVAGILAAAAGGGRSLRRRGARLRLLAWIRDPDQGGGAAPRHLGELAPIPLAVDRIRRRGHVARARARRARRRTRELLEIMSEGFVVVDREERITWANPSFAGMLGIPVGRLRGLELACLLDAEDQARLVAETEHRREGRPARYEFTWHRPDGERVEAMLSATPTADRHGRYRGFFAVVTDLTERRSLERRVRRAEKLRALGELSGGIAHDFNNRLTSILGHAQLLLMDPDEERVEASARVIEHSALEAAETVRRIMEFTRQPPESTREEVDPNALLVEALDLLRFREPACAGRIAIHRDLTATLPVSAFPAELREAFLNVLGNALDSMPTAGEIFVSTLDRPGGVAIRITDTGCGMSPETLERAFDPFFTTRSSNRTGLGLSVTWGVLQRHGGRIRLHSSPGRGTVVSFFLPAAVSESRDVPADATDVAGAGAGRAVVACGDERRRRMLRFALAQAGYRVETAGSRREALALLSRPPEPAIVVTSRSLADGEGADVANVARHAWPGIRIVLVTDGPRRDRDEGFRADVVIATPFTVPEFLSRVRSVAPEGLPAGSAPNASGVPAVCD